MKYATSKLAKAAAIAHYDGFCIMSGIHGGQIAGCHIFNAGSHPELKTYSENIIPLRFNLHTTGDNTFDWIVYQKDARNPIDKIWWLIDRETGVREEFTRRLCNQLLSLADVMSQYDRHVNNADALRMIIEGRWPQ